MTVTNSSTFCSPNMHNARALNSYVLSDFSSNSLLNDNAYEDHPAGNDNPYSSNVHSFTNNINDNNLLLPEIHHALSVPNMVSPTKHKDCQTDIAYGDSPKSPFLTLNDLNYNEEDDKSISYLENGTVDDLNCAIESSSGSCSIYTNTP
eukprot:291683_1